MRAEATSTTHKHHLNGSYRLSAKWGFFEVRFARQIATPRKAIKITQDATCSAKPALRTFWPKEGLISDPPSLGSPDCEIPNKVPPAIWTILQMVSNVTNTDIR
jgi:hypothetical protein